MKAQWFNSVDQKIDEGMPSGRLFRLIGETRLSFAQFGLS